MEICLLWKISGYVTVHCNITICSDVALNVCTHCVFLHAGTSILCKWRQAHGRILQMLHIFSRLSLHAQGHVAMGKHQ